MFKLTIEDKDTSVIKHIHCNICHQFKPNDAIGLCHSCYEELRRLKQHLESPMIKCQCKNTTCQEIIHSVNRSGFSSKFAPYHHHFGSDHHLWNNGEASHGEDSGYIEVLSRGHPFANRNGRVYKHRLALEEHLSKKYGMPIFILPYFAIHHIDRDTTNNDPSNLMMVTSSEHGKIHTPEIDMTKRRCSICNSNKTGIRKLNGRPHWYGNELDGWICRKCYKKRNSGLR